MINKYGFTKDQQEEINNIVRKYGMVDYSKKLNKVCFHTGHETHRHFMAKANLCWHLRNKKIPFLTEFGVKGKHSEINIPDILVLQPLVAIEILHTEKLSTFSRKVSKSADGIFFISLDSGDALTLDSIEELL